MSFGSSWRVRRGGSWDFREWQSRVWSGLDYYSPSQYNDLGFRFFRSRV
jgi:hypothetical protein